MCTRLLLMKPSVIAYDLMVLYTALLISNQLGMGESKIHKHKEQRCVLMHHSEGKVGSRNKYNSSALLLLLRHYSLFNPPPYLHRI